MLVISVELERVLTNLLGNAAQYAGGATMDHGPSIAAEDIETIFKRF